MLPQSAPALFSEFPDIHYKLTLLPLLNTHVVTTVTTSLMRIVCAGSCSTLHVPRSSKGTTTRNKKTKGMPSKKLTIHHPSDYGRPSGSQDWNNLLSSQSAHIFI